VDLAAPGRTIYSTNINSGYRLFTGTSMATPLVAGAAVLAQATAMIAGKERLRLCLQARGACGYACTRGGACGGTAA
jgi:hypothetical protein